jgi:GNAT superfamily N-acetyltransferase
MIRKAVLADRPAIVRMARDFHAAANMPVAFDAAYAAAVAGAYIADADKLCLVLDRDGPAGVLAAHAYAHLLAPVLAADELMWWVDPGHRGLAAMRMLSAYEDWARSRGCALIGIATPPSDDRAAALYRRRGYSAAGAHFSKTI